MSLRWLCYDGDVIDDIELRREEKDDEIRIRVYNKLLEKYEDAEVVMKSVTVKYPNVFGETLTGNMLIVKRLVCMNDYKVLQALYEEVKKRSDMDVALNPSGFVGCRPEEIAWFVGRLAWDAKVNVYLLLHGINAKIAFRRFVYSPSVIKLGEKDGEEQEESEEQEKEEEQPEMVPIRFKHHETIKTRITYDLPCEMIFGGGYGGVKLVYNNILGARKQHFKDFHENGGSVILSLKEWRGTPAEIERLVEITSYLLTPPSYKYCYAKANYFVDLTPHIAGNAWGLAFHIYDPVARTEFIGDMLVNIKLYKPSPASNDP